MKVRLPSTLDEACALVASEPEAIPIAGGTDLMVHWPQRLEAHGRTYVDLSGIDGLRSLDLHARGLTLGARTTYWDVLSNPAVRDAFPLLAEAARQVGAIQIQSRGTWAGNVMNASPAADGTPVLMAYGAEVELVSRTGSRRVPLEDFYTGYRSTRRRPDELVSALHLPLERYDFQRFEKVGARRAQAITKVGVAVTHGEQGWRIVANSVAPTVCRCPALEAMLANGQPITSPEDLLPPIDRDVRPIDDLRSTAAYRRQVLANVLYTLLAEYRRDPSPVDA